MIWLLLVPALLVASLMALWLVGERGHLLLPSTRAALHKPRERGTARSTWNALHGYVYGRWPYRYISFCMHTLLPRMKPRFKQWWAEHYHGKVLPTELACHIIKLDHDIKRTDLDRVIPYATARDIVLSSEPAVTLLECPCRHARENPCQPTQVCMVVGGGDFTLEHHPKRSRRVSQREALELLQAEHERGHVHTAYFKDACDNRFYAICNCCRCCCGGLEAMVEHGVPMVASSGYVAQIDEGSCIACEDCRAACPFGAIEMYDRATVVWEKCMGCGVCDGQCDMEAITLALDDRKGLPLDVRHIGLTEPGEASLAATGV